MTTVGHTRLLKILIVGGGEVLDDAGRLLDPNAHVEHADTLDAGLQALQVRDFDVVVAGAADLVPLQHAALGGHALAVLDSISQGVCIVQQGGAMEWANPKMLSLPQDVRDQISRHCVEMSSRAQSGVPSGAASSRGRRLRIASGTSEHFEVSATPIVDLHERVTRIAAVVWDVTGAERLQEKIDAIDQAGRELLSLDGEQFSRLESQERLSLIEQKIQRCTCDLLHFDNFEIRILDPQTNRLDLVLSFGIPADSPNVDLYACADGNGICGYVAARGRSYICPNVNSDPRYIPGIEHARSSLTVPLFLHERVVGVANFECTKLAAFSEDDRQFAEIFGRYISLALHILKLLVSERQATTGQLGRSVMAEITAPVNDILTDVECLVEDYIGHDDLRHRLRAISENAARIRETIKELVQPAPGVILARSSPQRRHDPILDGRRILLADDEDVIRETIRDVLTGYGCLVETASDGATAIDLVRTQPFDLVLSDIKMPVKSGYEVFAAAKAANPATHVILTTGFGYDPNHSIVRARREGLAAVLFKPFKVDQLLIEIRNALKPAAK
jgi:CheY-like chemotaxis protein